MNKKSNKNKIVTYYSIYLLCGLTFLSNCKSKSDEITIRGRAYSYGKMGACLRTKRGKNYQINDMYDWPAKYEAKKLVVKGKFRIYCDTTPMLPDEERQRIFGCQYFLDSAKYRVTIFGFFKKELKIEE